MTGQQLATLVILLVMILFSAWAYRESLAHHRSARTAEPREQAPAKKPAQKSTGSRRKK